MNPEARPGPWNIKKAADQVASLYALLVYHAGICMVVRDESFAMNPSWLR